jgi:hypothetical protein
MTPSRLSSLALAASFLLFTGCNPTPKPEPTPNPQPEPTPAPKSEAAPSITPSANEPHHSWSEQQILTCTVSQCWQLADKNEDSFFDIVQELAVLSAKNRNLTLPEDEEAGKKTGEYIKAQAKADHEQLLFAVVDAAVRKVGTPETNSTK